MLELIINDKPYQGGCAHFEEATEPSACPDTAGARALGNLVLAGVFELGPRQIPYSEAPSGFGEDKPFTDVLP